MTGDIRPFGELFAEPTRNGLTRPKAVRGDGVKMVNMGELFAYPRLQNALMDRVPLSDREAERFLLKDGDLLFARQSLVLEGAGKCSIFLSDREPVTFESHVTRVRLNGKEASPLFYYYYLQSHHGRSAIRSIVEQGAGASGIRGSDLERLNVLWRPVAEQLAIASVLGALDDKIELNRHMNATLEAMACALFKSWFVDFDPVRAKREGRQPPGLDPVIADLFPDSFEESALGDIPRGWTVEPVGEVVTCVGGGTPSTSEPKYWESGTHHWTTPKDFSSLQAPILIDSERRITDAGVARISSGILPVGTLLMSSRAPVGYLAISAIPVAINQGFIAMKCNERASNYFMLNWCQHNMAGIKGRATGTTFAEISKQNFRPIPLLLSSKELMAAFTRAVTPLYAQIAANLHQSHTLATLRDTLLPKLLSGELRVPEAMRQVEAAHA